MAKEPKAAARHWFPPAGEPSDDREALFIALLLQHIALETHKVQECATWAEDIIRLAGSCTGSTLPDSAEFRMRPKPGALVKPLFEAHQKSEWPDVVLDKIAIAMHNWDGPGRVENLKVENLKYHLRSNPGGPKPPGSKKPALGQRASHLPQSSASLASSRSTASRCAGSSHLMSRCSRRSRSSSRRQ